MIDLHTLLLFTTTTAVVVLSPGPAVIAVTAEAMSNGVARASWVVLGIAVANALYFVLSATGIAALILASNTLFQIIKWIGVLYLVYLGLNAIFSKSGALGRGRLVQAASRRRTFLKGLILELANPKALLYFAALLPQFVNPAEPVFPQLALFCAITFVLDIVCYGLYARLGASSSAFTSRPRVQVFINRAAGFMLMFAGIRMAMVER